MLEQVIHYQTGIFAPDTRLEPSASNIGTLLELFKDKGFIPITQTVIEVSGTMPLAPKLQLNLATQRQDWTVAFEKERVNCIWSKIDKTDSLTIDQFIQEAPIIIKQIDTRFPLHGWRLFFNMKGILPELSNEEMMRINNIILNIPLFFKESQPVLWSTRNQSRKDITFRDGKETLNIILDVNRVKIQFRTTEPSEPQDRVEIYLDINTLQTNKDQRFGADDLEAYLVVAKAISQEILSQLEDLFK